MNEQRFQRLLLQAKAFPGDYSHGYQLGLRRHYYGDKFGDPGEHEARMKMGQDGDPREDLGRGYRDGFAGRPFQQDGFTGGGRDEPTTRHTVHLTRASHEVLDRMEEGSLSEKVNTCILAYGEKS